MKFSHPYAEVIIQSANLVWNRRRAPRQSVNHRRSKVGVRVE